MIRLAAIEGARRDGLRAEGEEVPWGEIENRPYLSACAHLALTRLHQGRHAEAARLFEELLRQEPDGEALHLAGDLDRARDVYEGLFGDSCADFNLALVEIERGNPELAPRPLLRGFGGSEPPGSLRLWARRDELTGAPPFGSACGRRAPVLRCPSECHAWVDSASLRGC